MHSGMGFVRRDFCVPTVAEVSGLRSKQPPHTAAVSWLKRRLDASATME